MDVFFRLLTGFRTVCHCESRQSISSISHGSSISFLPCSSPSCGKSCGSELSSTGRIGPHFISTFLPSVSHWLMVVLWTPHGSLAINGISFWSNVIQNSSRSTRTGTRTSKLYFWSLCSTYPVLWVLSPLLLLSVSLSPLVVLWVSYATFYLL